MTAHRCAAGAKRAAVGARRRSAGVVVAFAWRHNDVGSGPRSSLHAIGQRRRACGAWTLCPLPRRRARLARQAGRDSARRNAQRTRSCSAACSVPSACASQSHRQLDQRCGGAGLCAGAPAAVRAGAGTRAAWPPSTTWRARCWREWSILRRRFAKRCGSRLRSRRTIAWCCRAGRAPADRRQRLRIAPLLEGVARLRRRPINGRRRRCRCSPGPLAIQLCSCTRSRAAIAQLKRAPGALPGRHAAHLETPDAFSRRCSVSWMN
jgi:hypothetical protein